MLMLDSCSEETNDISIGYKVEFAVFIEKYGCFHLQIPEWIIDEQTWGIDVLSKIPSSRCWVSNITAEEGLTMLPTTLATSAFHQSSPNHFPTVNQG